LQRRHFLAGLAVVGSTASFLVRAQANHPARAARIGIFHFGSVANFRTREDAFKREMRVLGYTETRAQFYSEGAYGQRDLLERTAKTFAREPFDVILSASSLTTDALRRAAPDTPIVIAAAEDPVAEKFAESLQRPGRNITGITASVLDHLRRHLEMLTQVAPRITRITALLNPDNATHSKYKGRLEGAARAGLRITLAEARNEQELERAFPVRPREDAEGVLVMNDGYFYTQRRVITELASRARRPAIYPLRGFVEAGGLMSHGPNLEANFTRAARLVDRILKGERASEIPFEPPARIELVLNRDVADSLKLAFPPELVKEATSVLG
jgi:putative ABC transport system substrate-binding protein